MALGAQKRGRGGGKGIIHRALPQPSPVRPFADLSCFTDFRRTSMVEKKTRCAAAVLIPSLRSSPVDPSSRCRKRGEKEEEEKKVTAIGNLRLSRFGIGANHRRPSVVKCGKKGKKGRGKEFGHAREGRSRKLRSQSISVLVTSIVSITKIFRTRAVGKKKGGGEKGDDVQGESFSANLFTLLVFKKRGEGKTTTGRNFSFSFCGQKTRDYRQKLTPRCEQWRGRGLSRTFTFPLRFSTPPGFCLIRS